ncbi:MAG TPA: carboxylating nicotinate-nucleotide diphosphorylase [Acidimicrobiales bacterium]|nr:carboxylating nicotinate-nucleotide diphosphorylase [Acidimicrobiales bacterium]
MIVDVNPPLAAVREVVARALAEDVLPLGDLSAGLVPAEAQARAILVSRGEGTMAGRLCVAEVFAQLDPGVKMDWVLDDGDVLVPRAVIGVVVGALRSVLTAERSLLNLLSHLSGVASLTHAYVRAVSGTGVRILDTRKTTPGLRALEKAAVRAGGGHNHRGNLSEFVLVKDNHLAGVSITEAVQRATARWPMRMVEVECDRIEQVREALAAEAGGVLLDNMTPETVAACVTEVGGRVSVEVSGGVTLDTVRSYAEAGPDFISVGAITASAPALDIGLDLEA